MREDRSKTEVGRRHAEQVALALQHIAQDVRIVELSGLPPGGDVSDWLERGGTPEKLMELVEASSPYQPRERMLQPRITPLGQYFSREGAIYWRKPDRDGCAEVQLTNFDPRIIASLARDDGVEVHHSLEIEASVRARTRRFVIPAGRFSSMGWVLEELGPEAIVSAGMAIKDRAREAIQALSPDIANRTIYTHTGWRQIEGCWVYLHAAGALGPKGDVDGVEVELPLSLQPAVLGVPGESGRLEAGLRACLRLLELAPDPVTVPLLGSVWRAPLGHCDHSVHLVGETGTGKSELAALCQQHFGAGFRRLQLPAAWSSTGNALEVLAFTAKDMLLVVDDFCPSGGPHDAARLHREADRLIRAQGNRSGRQRLRSDGTPRSVKYPRGFILSTGEDVPRGQSLRARLLVVEVNSGDLQWSALSRAQEDAANGLYAAAMSGFLRSIGARYEEVQRRLSTEVPDLVRQASSSNLHKRTPSIVANLSLGIWLFLEFATDIGVLTVAECEQLWARCWEALGVVAREQADHLSAAEPAARFFELLSSAIASGHAHVACPNGGPPANPEAWGWRRDDTSLAMNLRPKGDRIGWCSGEDVYLDSGASYAVAQRMAAAGGEPIAVGEHTLRKRLRDKGHLVSVDVTRGKILVRRPLEGKRRAVLHIEKSLLSPPAPAQSAHSAPSHAPEGQNAHVGASSGAGDAHADSESAHENGPSQPPGRPCGPNGPDGPPHDGSKSDDPDEVLTWTG